MESTSEPSPEQRRIIERLESLEIKASFTEDLLDQLNMTIYQQQQLIDRLTHEVIQLRQQARERVVALLRRVGELQRVFHRLAEQLELRAELGPRFDPKALDSAEAKQAVLDNVVLERALAAEIDRSKVVITPAMLKQFYDLNFIGADGKFSLDRYRQEALFNNMTTKGLDADYARRLSVQQVAY
eukprot:gene40637-53742_t